MTGGWKQKSGWIQIFPDSGVPFTFPFLSHPSVCLIVSRVRAHLTTDQHFWCSPVIFVSEVPSLFFSQTFVGNFLIGWCMNRLRTGVLYGTVLSVHSLVPGNFRSSKVKIVMWLVVKLGTLKGVPSPIGPAILPLYL